MMNYSQSKRLKDLPYHTYSTYCKKIYSPKIFQINHYKSKLQIDMSN